MTAPKVKFGSEKYFWYLLYLAASLFALFFFVVSYNNRLNTTDDFMLLELLKEHGPLDALSAYSNLKRVTGFFVFNLSLYPNSDFAYLKWNLLIVYSLFFVSFVFAFKRLLDIFFNANQIKGLTYWKSLCIAVLIVESLFFFTFQNNEVWFWYICFLIYLLPLNLVLWGSYFLSSTSLWKQIAALFLFFIAGACFEPLAATVSVVFLLFFIYYKARIWKFFWASFFIALPVLFNFFGTGMDNRVMYENQMNAYHTFDLMRLFANFADKKNLFYLVLLAVFFALGNYMRHQLKQTLDVQMKQLSLYFLVLLASCFFFVYMATNLVFHSAGPLRSWSPLSYILGLELLILVFIWGNKTKQNLAGYKLLFPALLLMLFIPYSLKQYHLTSAYAQQFDENIQLINHFKQTNNSERDTLYIHKLPDPGVLIMSDDIPNLERIMDFQFVIRVKEN